MLYDYLPGAVRKIVHEERGGGEERGGAGRKNKEGEGGMLMTRNHN